MVRTVISLDADDKNWLDEKSRRARVPMTALVRDAIRRYRRAEASRSPEGIDSLLEATKGVWTEGDGLKYQRRLRAEWDR